MKTNLTDTADLLGVSLPTIRKYISEGMPFDQKGSLSRKWVFDMAKCISWSRDREVRNTVGDVTEVDIEGLRKRKLAAETTLAEIEAAQKKGEVVYISDVLKIRALEGFAVKAKLLAIPQRIDHILAASSDRKFCKETLTEEIIDALDELKTGTISVDADLDSVDEHGSNDGLVTPAKPEAKRGTCLGIKSPFAHFD